MTTTLAVRRVLRSTALPWALVAVLLVTSVVLASMWRSERADDERRAEVQTAARSFLRALTNFSAETIEADVERIRGFAVGRFADELDQTFSPERVQAIKDQNAVSTGRIESVFVEEIGPDTATAFGVVAETVANDQTEEPRADILRVEVGLIETDEAWRIERLTLLQTPTSTPA
jgi:Mce-associated membrane protein